MLQDEPSDSTMIPQWSCCEHLWAILALGKAWSEVQVPGYAQTISLEHPIHCIVQPKSWQKPGTHAASLTDPSRCLWCFLEQHLIREGCTVLHYPIAETDPILKTMGTYWQATHVVRSIKEPLRERKKCLFEVYNRGLEDGGCKCADSSNVPSFGLTMCFSFTPSSCESMAVNRLYSHFLYFLGYALDRLTFAIPSCSQPIERRFPSSFHPGGSMI